MLVLEICSTLYKNILQRQNPYEIVLKDISKLGKQNPIVGSLLGEIAEGKLTNKSIMKFLDSSPSVKDLKTKQHLENLKESNRISKQKSVNTLRDLRIKTTMIVARTNAVYCAQHFFHYLYLLLI